MRPLLLPGLLFLAACTIQLPTEKQEVADLRPQISFSMADPGDEPAAYHVFVDGLDMGVAQAYLAGRTALKVLSGTHVVKVERNGVLALEQRIYLGDGATRTFVLSKP